MNSFGEQIQNRRKALKLSQQQLADKLGRKQSWISRIEANQVDLRVSNLVQIARALNMELMLVNKNVQDVVLTLKDEQPLSQSPWQPDEESE